MKTPDCVIDGEVCALDEAGRSSFSEMQQLKPSTPLVYYVFDLLEVEGEPLVDLPIEERRARLEELLDKRYRMVRISEFFDDGHALLKVAKDNELEGIVAKRAGSRYAVGKRTRDWLKVKTARRPGARHRRLHEGAGTALEQLRLARPRLLGGEGAGLRRERRNRLRRQGDPEAARQAQAAGARRVTVPRGAEDAQGAKG